MAARIDEATPGLFSSAARGSRLGELRWGVLPLAAWALLALALVRAVTVASPLPNGVGAPGMFAAPDAEDLRALNVSAPSTSVAQLPTPSP